MWKLLHDSIFSFLVIQRDKKILPEIGLDILIPFFAVFATGLPLNLSTATKIYRF